MACEYCTFRRDGSAKPITNEDTRIYLLGGHGYGAYNKSLLDRGLNVQVEIDYAESAHYQDTDVGVSGFNFCPMCGRDLRDKN